MERIRQAGGVRDWTGGRIREHRGKTHVAMSCWQRAVDAEDVRLYRRIRDTPAHPVPEAISSVHAGPLA